MILSCTKIQSTDLQQTSPYRFLLTCAKLHSTELHQTAHSCLHLQCQIQIKVSTICILNICSSLFPGRTRLFLSTDGLEELEGQLLSRGFFVGKTHFPYGFNFQSQCPYVCLSDVPFPCNFFKASHWPSQSINIFQKCKINYFTLLNSLLEPWSQILFEDDKPQAFLFSYFSVFVFSLYSQLLHIVLLLR